MRTLSPVSPVPDGRLDGIKTRIERAQENVLRFYSEELAYFEKPKPYEWGLVFQGSPPLRGTTGQVVLRIVTSPPDWSLLIADIITDLRFALDYLAYELVVGNTGVDPPPDARTIEFPIYLDEDKFNQRNNHGEPAGLSGLRKIQNMDPTVQDFIEGLQPYKYAAFGLPEEAGIFRLSEMCNVYKHRLLAPVLLAVKNVELAVKGNRCTVTRVDFHEPEGQLGAETVFADFSSPDFGMESTVRVQAKHFPYIGFPIGTPAYPLSVRDFLNGAVGTVRHAVQEATKLQWGEPLELAGPAHTVVPLPDDSLSGDPLDP